MIEAGVAVDLAAQAGRRAVAVELADPHVVHVRAAAVLDAVVADDDPVGGVAVAVDLEDAGFTVFFGPSKSDVVRRVAERVGIKLPMADCQLLAC